MSELKYPSIEESVESFDFSFIHPRFRINDKKEIEVYWRCDCDHKRKWFFLCSYLIPIVQICPEVKTGVSIGFVYSDRNGKLKTFIHNRKSKHKEKLKELEATTVERGIRLGTHKNILKFLHLYIHYGCRPQEEIRIKNWNFEDTVFNPEKHEIVGRRKLISYGYSCDNIGNDGTYTDEDFKTKRL